jgi:hypothetical protein
MKRAQDWRFVAVRAAFDVHDLSVAEEGCGALRTDCARKWVRVRFLRDDF